MSINIEAARRMGEVGGPAVESERLAFEAWMAGHCWALCATWTGTEYRSDSEQGGWPDPQAMMTRRLWAVWRDRAALAQQPVANGEPVAWTLRETLDKRETTIRGYLWFTDPKNSSWVPLYAGTKSAG